MLRGKNVITNQTLLKCEVFCYTLSGDDMLKKIIDKRNYIIFFIIIVLIIWVVWSLFFHKREPYVETFNYYGEEITFKVYDKVNHNKLTNDINNIYKKYENVNELKGKVNEDEKSLIEYGKILYYKTGGYVDVTSGELIDKIKDDKEYSFESDIEKVEIKDDKLVNDINFNFDSIIGSYATNEVLYYFKQNKITKYIVSENGDVAVGEHYSNDEYSISISKPNSDEVLEIVSLENKAMASRYTTSEFKSYMVNPVESKVTKKYDTVVVISDDVNEGTMLANALYLMDREAGEKLVKEYDAAALWYVNDKTYTLNFDKYTGD